MKFTCTTHIKASREMVVSCFLKEEVMLESQDGFIRKIHQAGKPWEVGSTSKLLYNKLELMETIISNKLPTDFKALYEHKHMVNTMHSTFTVVDDETTRLDQEIHYTQFIGFIPKIMASLFPGIFRKQVQKWLDKFKEVVEVRAES